MENVKHILKQEGQYREPHGPVSMFIQNKNVSMLWLQVQFLYS